MEQRKKFRLADVVLSVICVVFVAEAAAPVASIGNSQYFWWVFMMIAFLLPYGMISSELGTTYTGDGGLYDWINKAFPRSKWGGARLVVLLDQLPAVDGLARRRVPGAAERAHGAAVRVVCQAAHRAGLHLDRHVDRVLPRVRQHPSFSTSAPPSK